MKEQIYSLIKNRQHVSFAELAHEVENFSGEFAIYTPPYENVILWPSLSEQALIALIDLLKEERVFAHPSSLLIYAIDQMRPSFPIAKGFKHYKTTRWLPVVLCTFPFQRKK